MLSNRYWRMSKVVCTSIPIMDFYEETGLVNIEELYKRQHKEWWWINATESSWNLYLIEPPYTERYVRWCERKAPMRNHENLPTRLSLFPLVDFNAIYAIHSAILSHTTLYISYVSSFFNISITLVVKSGSDMKFNHHLYWESSNIHSLYFLLWLYNHVLSARKGPTQ